MRRFFAWLAAAALLICAPAHAGAVSPPAPNTHAGAAYTFMQKVKAGNQVATILINSDSTGADSNGTAGAYQFNKLAYWIAAQNPANTVYYYLISGSSWASPTVLQNGTGSGIVRIYNGAVSGTQAFYFYGSTFNSLYIAGLASTPDVIIINHGKNNDYTQQYPVLVSMVEAQVAQLSNAYPLAGLILLKQNPDPTQYIFAVTDTWGANKAVTSGAIWQSGPNAYTAGSTGTTGTTVPVCTSGTCSDGTITWTYTGVAQQEDVKARATQDAAALLGAEVVDNYNTFLAVGNPSSWFANTVHQSQIGDTAMAANLIAAFSNVVAPLPHRVPLLERQNCLLANCKMQTMTGGTTSCPDSWTCTNTTISQYTTSYENGGAYAVKFLNTATGLSSVAQTITGAALKPLLGKYVTFAARVQLIDTTDTSSCALEINSNSGRTYRTWGMSASGNYTGGYIWLSTTGIVGTSDTTITMTIYPTRGGSTASGHGCYVDRVNVVPGMIPMDVN